MASKRWLQALGTCCALAVSAVVSAQSYPSKSIRFIVGFPPGGTNDIVARLFAPKLAEGLGQQVVVDNRGGANTAIASELFVHTPPDGYTIMLNGPGHSTNPSLIKLNFDPIRDFTFVTLVAESQNMLVTHPSLPVKSVKELIAFSKKHPGEINYGSSGIGSTVHLSAELFKYMTGVKWVHIAYKGGGPGLTALLSGEVSLYFGNVPTVISQVRRGKLRALAVTGAKPSSAAPDIPVISQSGVPGYEVTAWYGLSLPAKTPQAIVDRVSKEAVRALNDPGLRKRLSDLGADAVGNSPDEYAAFIRKEIDKWAKVIKAAGIKAQ